MSKGNVEIFLRQGSQRQPVRWLYIINIDNVDGYWENEKQRERKYYN
ncbi:MAG TPA: hypothetical protein VHB48_18320 [Chitinophagaceae bacterium]|nr:hypothetical protein [Chitinophagaceae bacterium]